MDCVSSSWTGSEEILIASFREALGSCASRAWAPQDGRRGPAEQHLALDAELGRGAPSPSSPPGAWCCRQR